MTVAVGMIVVTVSAMAMIVSRSAGWLAEEDSLECPEHISGRQDDSCRSQNTDGFVEVKRSQNHENFSDETTEARQAHGSKEDQE